MEIKERILQTAERMFFKFGIRSVTMDDIAGELGISKKTIYQLFEDKDAIVHQVALQSFECDKIEYERIYQEAKNPVDEIFRNEEFMRQSFAEMHPSVILDFKKYYPKIWLFFQEHKESFIKKTIQRNLEEGVQQGFYRAEIDTDFLAKMRIEVIELGFNTEIFPSEKYNFIDVQLKLTDHFLHGILTTKGLQLFNEYKNA